MRINHNLQSLRALNNQTKILKKNDTHSAKISSGLAINKAADDAAGLSISEGMRAQIRGLVQADRNIQDAESLLQTAEGVLGGTNELLQRMRELTIQAQNDTLTPDDRMMIQNEFRQLQLAVDGSPEEATWSGMSVVDMHEPVFSQIEGNRHFPGGVRIIEGYNDDLEITIDGVLKTLKIAEGTYEPVEVLADYLDDVLMELDPNIIIHLTGDRTLSIQAENHASINQISGGASSLFYEYELGRPPGMIVGVTKYQGGEVKSIPGVSDELTLYVGSDRQYTITFPPGTYSRQEAIDEINRQLVAKGENDAKAEAYGEERIALVSNKYVITGLGGNMIEIDNITSILYDNRKKGSITKTQAAVSGYKDLTAGVQIEKGVNDRLTFYIQGQRVDVSLLADDEADQTFLASQILQKINRAIGDKGINATASLSGGRLEIRDDYFGAQSKVVVDKLSSAYDSLFVQHTTTYPSVTPSNGRETTASFQGNYGLGETTVIDAGNSTLTGKVNGVEFSVTLEEKTYTKAELMDALNEQAAEQGISLVFSHSSATRNGNSYVSVRHTESVTGNFVLNTDSPLFPTLMKGITITEPVITQGRTETVPEVEGVVRPPEYIETPATAQGRSSLDGLVLTDENNVLTVEVNGDEHTITFQPGTYATAQSFLAAHQTAFREIGLEASADSSGRLVLTTAEVGQGRTISSFGGSSHEWIMGGRTESVPSFAAGTGSQTTSTIQGIYQIPTNLTIDGSNDSLSFTYQHEGADYLIDVQLPAADYANAALVAFHLGEEISKSLEAHGLPTDAISVTSSGGKLRIETAQPGSSYTFSDFKGNLFMELFRKQERVLDPASTGTGRTDEKPTYIVGRENLATKEIIINPHVNDRLLFDFEINGAKQVIELKLKAGSYSAGSLVSELNRSLAEELAANNLDRDLIKAQIGGVENATDGDGEGQLVFKINRMDDGRDDSGRYVIDGVRGSAAYTVFYQAQGEPAPSYTIGVTNLSGGAVIETGKNDVLSFDVDGIEKTITLPEGNYTAETLLAQLNSQLDAQNAGVSASLFEGRLKISSKEVGQITIDGFRGNARDALLFKMDARKEDTGWAFQVGANSGDQIFTDKPRVSAKLLRVNTLMVDDPARARKALQRLDAALAKISSERSRMGAVTNRLGHSMKIAQHTAENLVSSESKIRDADIAKEMMGKVKSDILLQANQLVLAKANANPQGVLELLK